jgi:hypothetical protein
MLNFFINCNSFLCICIVYIVCCVPFIVWGVLCAVFCLSVVCYLCYIMLFVYCVIAFPALPKKKVVGLERGPLSLVSTTEETHSGSCLENLEYGRRDPSRWPRGTLYPKKVAITSPTSGGRSVGIVRWRTQTMEINLVFSYCSTTATR